MKLKNCNLELIAVVVGMLAVCTIHLLAPRGTAIWILLIPLIAISRISKVPGLPLVLTVLSILFLFIDLFLLKTEPLTSQALSRRIIGSIALLGAGLSARRVILTEVKLTRINEQKDRLMSMVAHDVRNPVGAIHSLVGLLKTKEISPNEFNQYLTLIERSSRLSLDILSEIQNFANLDGMELHLHNEKIKISTLLPDLLAINKIVAMKKNINIEVSDYDNNLIVSGDKMLLHRAIQNLIDNAIKYSHPGSKVEINVSGSKDEVKIDIKDYGLGISEDEQQLLFQPFARTSNKPTGGESSTCLGLASAAKIIELHKGKIQVESQKGVGSTFTVVLPRTHQTFSKKKPNSWTHQEDFTLPH